MLAACIFTSIFVSVKNSICTYADFNFLTPYSHDGGSVSVPVFGLTTLTLASAVGEENCQTYPRNYLFAAY